jgi:hypothetical protein
LRSTFFQHQSGKLKKELARNEGILEPGSELAEERNCNPAIADSVALYIGPHTFFLQKFPQDILTIGNRTVLAIDKIGADISVSKLELFDEAGAVFATVDNQSGTNSFWISPNSKEVRPDRHTLVVYDRNNDEALRVKFINPKVISINGVFRHANSGPVIFQPHYFQIGGIKGNGGGCSPGAVFQTVFKVD